MITIDMPDEHVTLPEKPEYMRHKPATYRPPGTSMPVHNQVLSYHRELVENAAQARRLRQAMENRPAVNILSLLRSAMRR